MTAVLASMMPSGCITLSKRAGFTVRGVKVSRLLFRSALAEGEGCEGTKPAIVGSLIAAVEVALGSLVAFGF